MALDSKPGCAGTDCQHCAQVSAFKKFHLFVLLVVIFDLTSLFTLY